MKRLNCGNLETDSEYSVNSYCTQSSTSTQSSFSEQTESTPTNFSRFFTELKAESENNIKINYSGRKTPTQDGGLSVQSNHTPKHLSRPPFSFSQLIRDELLEKDNLTVNEICELLCRKHPKYFSMDNKKLKANVSNCLSSKNDFVKDSARKKRCYWSLSPLIKAKLKSPGCHGHMEENIPRVHGSATKYVPIAPKVHCNESYSLDGFARNTEGQLTPLKECTGSILNRQCQSEGKCQPRCLGSDRKRSPDGELDGLGTTKKKLFTERTSRKESKRMRFREKLDSDGGYRIRIQGICCTQGNDSTFFDEIYCTPIGSTGNSSADFSTFDFCDFEPDLGVTKPPSVFQDMPDITEDDEQPVTCIKKVVGNGDENCLTFDNTNESCWLVTDKAGADGADRSRVDTNEVDTNEVDTNEFDAGEVNTDVIKTDETRELEEVFDELSQSSFCESPYHLAMRLSPGIDLSPLDDLPDLFSSKEKAQK